MLTGTPSQHLGRALWFQLQNLGCALACIACGFPLCWAALKLLDIIGKSLKIPKAALGLAFTTVYFELNELTTATHHLMGWQGVGMRVLLSTITTIGVQVLFVVGFAAGFRKLTRIGAIVGMLFAVVIGMSLWIPYQFPFRLTEKKDDVVYGPLYELKEDDVNKLRFLMNRKVMKASFTMALYLGIAIIVSFSIPTASMQLALTDNSSVTIMTVVVTVVQMLTWYALMDELNNRGWTLEFTILSVYQFPQK
ncbi:hypothetical protein HDU96_004197, partial [Phlyctochytrium bullatum]